MSRARSDVTHIAADIVAAVVELRKLVPNDDTEALERWATVESFIAIALRVFAKTNPSKLREAAMIEEIKARMDGRGVIR